MCTSFRLGDLSRFQTLESTETGTYRRIHSWLKELPQQSPSRRKQKLHISWACGEFFLPDLYNEHIFIPQCGDLWPLCTLRILRHWAPTKFRLRLFQWDPRSNMLCYSLYEKHWIAVRELADCASLISTIAHNGQRTLGAKATRTLAAERVIVHIFGAEPRLMPKKQNDLWCLPTCCSWDSRVSWHHLFPSRECIVRAIPKKAAMILYKRPLVENITLP